MAVSGGPDSLALLLIAAEALPGRVEAATIDHGLRTESSGEAAEVAAVCGRLGVPHATLGVTVAPGNLQSGNLQAGARTARYAALGRWAGERGLAAIATAHHADDQAETFLMRANRGSGVGGLAGVRQRTAMGGLCVLRPLLGWRRAELAEVVARSGPVAADDPSNRATRFDRVRLRQALAEAPWLDPAALATSAACLGDAEAALEWAARREWDEAVSREGGELAYRPAAPRAGALRVLARILAEMSGDGARGSAVARLHDTLAQGQTGTLAGVRARSRGGVWRFCRETRLPS